MIEYENLGRRARAEKPPGMTGPPNAASRRKSGVTYPVLDLVRFAAALLVVFYHLAFYWWQGVPERRLGITPWVSCGWIGVEVFFVISGFVIAFSADGKSSAVFVKSRAARLYPAVWVCATVSFLLAPTSVATYLRSLALFPIGPWVDGVYWTLPIEMSFYALVAVALARRWKLDNMAVWLGCYSSAFWALKALNLIVPFADFTWLENHAGYLLLCHFGCFFAAGMLLYSRRKPAAAAVFFVTSFIASAWTSHAMHLAGAPFYVAPAVWLFATVLIVAGVFYNPWARKALSWAPTRTIGLMTYPLYLIHTKLGLAVMHLIREPVTSFCVGVLSAVAAAFIILPIEQGIRSAIRSGRVMRNSTAPAADLP
ncbi:MAG TPA: acyltransferase [Sphingomicrobium sp.]|nr:acyltransferase [Sphingomicrobium sp.]